MGDTGPFAVGASVLVPHTDRFYEAKVLKAQKREDGQWYYLIHYIGWNKKWDEWVEQTGLQPASEAAALNLQPPAKAAKQKGSAGGAAAAAAAAAWQRSKASVDGAAVQAGPSLDLEMSGALKQQLLNDYAAVHLQGRTLPLPRAPTVADVCRAFLDHARRERERERGGADAVATAASGAPLGGAAAAAALAADADHDDFVNGLAAYFDKSLAHCLLYPSERAQARRALAGGALPSSLYGAEHLLRLFVKLPELLPQVPAMTQDHLNLLRQRLEGVMSFIQERSDEFFLPTAAYIPAAPGDDAPAPAGDGGGGGGGGGGVFGKAAGGGAAPGGAPPPAAGPPEVPAVGGE